MTRLDSMSASLTARPTVSLDRGLVRRLIVLFPASALEDPKVSRRIWEIASSRGLDVLILSLCNDYGEEARLRRKLVTMAAVIKDGIVSTDILIKRGNNWLRTVKNILQPGDNLACYEGQKAGLMRRSLEQVLMSNFDAPLHILSTEQDEVSSKSGLISRLLPWVGSLAIIIGFLWAEIEIVALPQDWTHTLLLYLCLFAEAGLIWGWNSLFM